VEALHALKTGDLGDHAHYAEKDAWRLRKEASVTRMLIEAHLSNFP